MFAFIPEWCISGCCWHAPSKCTFNVSHRWPRRDLVCEIFQHREEEAKKKRFFYHFATLTLSRFAHPKETNETQLMTDTTFTIYSVLHFSSFHRTQSWTFNLIRSLCVYRACNGTNASVRSRVHAFLRFCLVLPFSRIKYFNFLPSFGVEHDEDWVFDTTAEMRLKTANKMHEKSEIIFIRFVCKKGIRCDRGSNRIQKMHRNRITTCSGARNK